MNEINLTKLLFNHINCTETTYNITQLNELITNGIIKLRSFNQELEWKQKKSTYYIESLMLNIENQNIVLFKYEDDYYICDGLNRIKSFKKYIDNKLKLSPKGLEQYKSLATKKFKDLSLSYQKSFQENIYLNIKIYEYINKDHNLSEEERHEIIKYLYYIYNNCTKLELVDLQRAEFYDEEVSNKFKKELLENPSLIPKICAAYLIKDKQKYKQIDNIMVEIRNLLCLTYNDINSITRYSSKKERIKNIFIKGIKGYDSNKIFLDFNITIDILYNISKNILWKKEKSLHNKYFMEMMYWLVSTIKRKNLTNIVNLPIEELIKYFSNENFYLLFNSDTAFTCKQLKERLLIISEYANTYLGLEMNLEKTNEIKMNNSLPIQEYSYFPLNSISIKVSTFLKEAQDGKYDFSLAIQRNEINKMEIASGIIESMIIGIKLPPILVYEKNINGKIIRSIIDGKQRCCCILGFLGESYMDIEGNKHFSKKNNFTLKNLKILNELNGKSFNGKDNSKVIPENYKKILKNYELDFIIVNKDKIVDFNEKEHFIRLNGSYTPKKPFDIWYSTSDTQVTEQIKKIASKHINLFSKNLNSIYDIITRLAFIEYKKRQENDTNLRVRVKTSEIENWLKNLEKIKIENSITNPQLVKDIREHYINSIINIDIKFTNIENWLQNHNLKIENIFDMKNKKTSPKPYICLYYLLEDITIETLNSKYLEILENLKSFYKESKTILKEKELKDVLLFYKTKIAILDDTKHIESNQKIRQMIA